MKKLKEYTGGSHIYMKLILDSGFIAEIDVYLNRDGSFSYKTTADDNEALIAEIISAFNELY